MRTRVASPVPSSAPSPAPAPIPVLASWHDGPARTALTAFVTRVTTAGTPDFVSVPERIAVFDNDGTLWAEQPTYVQLVFAFDRIKALAPQHPEWASQEPFKSVLAGDLKAVMAGGEHALLQILAASHAGNTTAEFDRIVADKAGKPVGIQQQIGRRPVMAFGNSDGDFEMLEWTTTAPGPRLAMIVHHTDAEREWAYDRESTIGRLVRGLDEAAAKGWTVVDMKTSWATVFPPRSPAQ